MPINVHVVPALPPDPLTATADGSESWRPGGETEQTKWFGLEVANLRKAVNRFAPGLGDLISGFDFSGDGYLIDYNLQVISDSPPKSGAQIHAAPDGEPHVSVSKQPAIFNRVPLENGTQEPQEYELKVSLSRSDSVESSWGSETTLGASTTVEVSAGVEGVASAKASGTISYEQKSSEGHSESRQLDTGTEVALHATLAPGEQAIAGVTAWRGTVNLAVPVTAGIRGYVTLRIEPRHWWVLTAVRDIPSSGIKRGDRVHVTSCTIGIVDLVRAWNFPPRGIHLSYDVHDTFRLSTGEWVDAEAQIVDVPSDSEAAILGAVAASLEERTSVKGTNDEQ